MAEEKLYVKETSLLNRKAPGLNLKWLEITAMFKVQTEPLSQENARNAHNKLTENMKNKAGMQLNKLLLLVPIKNASMTAAPLFRIVIDITLLRQLFADELGDWGGGGRRLKNEQTPLSTSMRRR